MSPITCTVPANVCFGSKADIAEVDFNFGLVPIADIYGRREVRHDASVQKGNGSRWVVLRPRSLLLGRSSADRGDAFGQP